MVNEIKIFISYSHADEDLRRELEGHLAFLSEYGNPIWHDRKYPPGSEWAKEIDTRLDTSNIILLLISASFLSSRYCYEIEFKRAMERHREKGATIIPIILRDVYWEFGDLKGLQALPKDGKAVLGYYWKGNKDAAFRNVAEGIREIVDGISVKPQVVIPSVTIPPSQNMSMMLLDGNNFDELYLELGKLNYLRQRKVFKQFIDAGNQDGRQRIGAFLIHGEPECGQRWLLNRFLRQVVGCTTGKPYKFSFVRKGNGRSLEDLWSDLGEWCGLTDSDAPSPEKIADEVHKLWQTQTVTLILRGLHEIEQEYMEKFIEVFWIPLAERARSQPCVDKNYCLLFLVDERGCEWNFSFVRQIDAAWEPRVPVELERLTRFSDQELSNWMEAGVDILPSNLTIHDLLKDCDGGLPELVLKRVCKLCGSSWHKRENVWIMY